MAQNPRRPNVFEFAAQSKPASSIPIPINQRVKSSHADSTLIVSDENEDTLKNTINNVLDDIDDEHCTPDTEKDIELGNIVPEDTGTDSDVMKSHDFFPWPI
ncbi:hypothetical protein HK100_003404 [Physocladia obscura]|uniref:Uncharacterized protein n=1 Tax=Physocladia obscura TaxID=109957 RepID=A0AAD5SU92_9FUNG|nr:hypothetical protein HK100_003404 [Physocladia obscura]